jgi:hypothetical protein
LEKVELEERKQNALKFGEKGMGRRAYVGAEGGKTGR